MPDLSRPLNPTRVMKIFGKSHHYHHHHSVVEGIRLSLYNSVLPSRTSSIEEYKKNAIYKTHGMLSFPREFHVKRKWSTYPVGFSPIHFLCRYTNMCETLFVPVLFKWGGYVTMCYITPYLQILLLLLKHWRLVFVNTSIF